MAPPTTPTKPHVIIAPDAEDAPSERTQPAGLISNFADAARALRDGEHDDTGDHGEAASEAVATTSIRASTVVSTRPRSKRRRPGWGALVATALGSLLAGGPAYDQVTDRDDRIARVEKQANEHSGALQVLTNASSTNTAEALEARYWGAIEGREIDGKLAADSANLELLLDTLGIDQGLRSKLPQTSPEVETRRTEAITEYLERKRTAERKALRDTVAIEDTMGDR
jgi:hypothetical protein